MLNSRDTALLRDDVQENCRIWQELCKEAGMDVLITQTLRDDEYQATLYAQGRTVPGSIITNSKVTTFHGVGLAFDFCKNVKGHEYDDINFFNQCGQVAKQVGFSWGGDWKSFPDKPHIQWDNGGRFSGTDIRAGKLPPAMPKYKEDDDMTKEEVLKIIAEYEAAKSERSVSSWAKDAWDKAKAKDVLDGTAPQSNATREQLAVILGRLGLL